MSVSVVAISSDRGPWIATSAVARERSSTIARKPAIRSTSKSLTTWALAALATTRNRSSASR